MKPLGNSDNVSLMSFIHMGLSLHKGLCPHPCFLHGLEVEEEA